MSGWTPRVKGRGEGFPGGAGDMDIGTYAGPVRGWPTVDDDLALNDPRGMALGDHGGWAHIVQNLGAGQCLKRDVGPPTGIPNSLLGKIELSAVG